MLLFVFEEHGPMHLVRLCPPSFSNHSHCKMKKEAERQAVISLRRPGLNGIYNQIVGVKCLRAVFSPASRPGFFLLCGLTSQWSKLETIVCASKTWGRNDAKEPSCLGHRSIGLRRKQVSLTHTRHPQRANINDYKDERPPIKQLLAESH